MTAGRGCPHTELVRTENFVINLESWLNRQAKHVSALLGETTIELRLIDLALDRILIAIQTPGITSSELKTLREHGNRLKRHRTYLRKLQKRFTRSLAQLTAYNQTITR